MITKEKKEMPSKVWFITGGSSGLGRSFTETALSRGDSVMVIARNVDTLNDLVLKFPNRLHALSTDVTDRNAVFASVDRCVEIFGRIDIVINNAGQFLFGMVEEVTEEQAMNHMKVNFFGALWVVQAVTPVLRSQGQGHILQVTSMGANGGFASVGLYSASKSALDSLSEALAMEVESFGIKVTILQPGGYVTDLFTRGLTSTKENPSYIDLRNKLAKLWTSSYDAPVSLASAVVSKIVDIEEPPKKIVLGGVAYDQVVEMIDIKLNEYRKWEDLSREAD
ncbi:SDR family NAD(P)-dependent oxidoreductase [Sphingobacteruim zhuxiongii]|nr:MULTISPECIES: SDR family NAD(P)-dependent oxidoreductase [unclassified Sphingobacterium]